MCYSLTMYIDIYLGFWTLTLRVHGYDSYFAPPHGFFHYTRGTFSLGFSVVSYG